MVLPATSAPPDNLAELHDMLTEADVLDGGEVLPSLTLLVRDLFAELDRQG